jgi:hypothetical protein
MDEFLQITSSEEDVVVLLLQVQVTVDGLLLFTCVGRLLGNLDELQRLEQIS